MGLSIGIDLTDEYLAAVEAGSDNTVYTPTVICRDKKEDVWSIGEEAYRKALSGKGVLTDKLLSLLNKGGTSTISRKTYTAAALITRLISAVLSELLSGRGIDEISQVVVALRRADRKEMSEILDIVADVGIEMSRISIISHEEAFAHYTLDKDRELYFNMVALFDLEDERLSCYKLKVLRGRTKNSVIVESSDMEESFGIGIINSDSGGELADRIMTRTAENYLARDLYSSVFITGKGFERTLWAKNFTETVGRRRKLFQERFLFALGAAICADKLDNNIEDPYLIFCDTKTIARVSINVDIKGKISKLIMVGPGEAWFNLSSFAKVIVNNENYIDIDIEPINNIGQNRGVRIDLSSFPVRPNKCTKVSIGLKFNSANDMSIEVRDLGFGEIYESSGAVIREEVKLAL